MLKALAFAGACEYPPPEIFKCGGDETSNKLVKCEKAGVFSAYNIIFEVLLL